MIARLRGKVWQLCALGLVVDVGGVGYEVAVPAGERLPPEGAAVELYTYAVYREDSAALYGFTTAAARDFFAVLIAKVSGIGPKTALGLMSHLPPERLTAAIEAGDIATLTATPRHRSQDRRASDIGA
jgi:holliday junction DNA helicase RuvA